MKNTMQHTIRVLKVFAVAIGYLLLSVAFASSLAAQGFNEEFNSPLLDPAWEVVPTSWPNPRSHGFSPPANDFSLTANPGHLRYLLTAMTYHEGFLTNYQNSFFFYSCCLHDAGVELHRPLAGDYWRLETRVTYFMPFANGRSFHVRVYFGNGGANTYYVDIPRGRDVHSNHLVFNLWHKTGPNWPAVGSSDFAVLQNVLAFDVGAAEAPAGTFYYRIERALGVLTVQYSADGVSWITAYSHDLGIQLQGLPQHVVLAGHSWFVPAGSYADYDYVRLIPTVVPVNIDIKPGSFPNSLNPQASGVIPVAILTTGSFDASIVDPLSLRFGPAAAVVARAVRVEDVDSDGDLDLILHFNTLETGINCGQTFAKLVGKTVSGQFIEGSDSIRTVACK